MKKYLQGGVTEGGVTYPPDGVSPTKKKYHYYLCMKHIVDSVFQCYPFAACFFATTSQITNVQGIHPLNAFNMK
jgi:hypothetical protein